MKPTPKPTPIPIVAVPLDTPKETCDRLVRAGYCVVACDDPSKISVISPASPFQAGDMLMAAMHSLSDSINDSNRTIFVRELCRRMKLRETNP